MLLFTFIKFFCEQDLEKKFQKAIFRFLESLLKQIWPSVEVVYFWQTGIEKTLEKA